MSTNEKETLEERQERESKRTETVTRAGKRYTVNYTTREVISSQNN